MKSHGFSVLELMITIGLGLSLLVIFVQTYLNVKTNYLLQQSLVRLHENSLFAGYLLRQEIREAGYRGCAKLNLIGIQGFRAIGNSWRPALPNSLKDKVRPGTDVITIIKTIPTFKLTREMTKLNEFFITLYPPLNPDDKLVVTDCINTDTAIVKEVNNLTTNQLQQITLTANLSYLYKRAAYVQREVTETFFIQDTGRKNNHDKTIYSLYMQSNQNLDEELISGVEDMKISYGIWNVMHDGIDRYTPDYNVDDWESIKRVRVSLLLNSVYSVLDKSTQYSFNDERVTANDGLLRLPWIIEIGLRAAG